MVQSFIFVEDKIRKAVDRWAPVGLFCGRPVSCNPVTIALICLSACNDPAGYNDNCFSFFLKKQNTSSPWLNAKWNNGLQPPWAFYPLLYLLRSYAKKLFVGLVFRSVLHCILSSYLPCLSNTNLCWASLLLPLTHAINRWIQRSLFCLERGMKVPLFPAQSLCLVCY